jgi:hypothetical protein
VVGEIGNNGQVSVDVVFRQIALSATDVQIVFAMPNGVECHAHWEPDAHDAEVLRYLAGEYGEKIKEKVAGGGQDFQPSKPGFEPDQ